MRLGFKLSCEPARGERSGQFVSPSSKEYRSQFFGIPWGSAVLRRLYEHSDQGTRIRSVGNKIADKAILRADFHMACI